MAKLQWKTSRAVALILGLFVVYLCLRTRYYEYKSFVFLNKVPPSEAWEFVADFSNMKYLNPTIVDFNIVGESGNYDHWKYSTEYSEYLSHWPHLGNHAVAHFNVKHDTKKGVYVIASSHKTCMFYGLLCLDSESEFRFTKSNTSDGSFCEEAVYYQCPVIMSAFCRREVVFQRNAIMNNLKKHFTQSHKLL